ncbi:hypothetical protein SAMN02744133_107104 [Thalassospira xiamenensis M-5 = DSM 17429]|uniref:Uncharacterized protein n=2 Tax=Thalassospira xiamenensis TaxID=220697 RepID=A0A285TXS5_9PROT|nr:hypothetical protein [Thalassospira xiamenensis]AJD52945.1 hypothetical protein TH3_14165 [Thalassospira xiamenensis M-5 = DSM 17429]SIT19510.1 hypothetical protein SAMN02744133_107104 [Thalassospira xiamenensis M-5 = DSM 17429]SOC30149.1 hypothetical protein SAMN05428964_108135 [Thalassospira xiamenensis]
MTDGPFRNSKLSGRWKRYGRDLVSDATSQNERTAQACHSMLGDVDLAGISELLKGLKELTLEAQMDLDPVSLAESIFDNHIKAPLVDILQKHLLANLRDQMNSAVALDEAIKSAANAWIGETKNRIDEECIRARDIGDMTKEEYAMSISRNNETFSLIDPNALGNALYTGLKNTFRNANHNREGLDEGPDD